MPCRALDAFGHSRWRARWTQRSTGLNALSGIGCIRTNRQRVPACHAVVGLNALSGIGCIRTKSSTAVLWPEPDNRLNALSGIGCIRTFSCAGNGCGGIACVLMPCRALDAFGRCAVSSLLVSAVRLNALSGIGCIRTRCGGRGRPGLLPGS